MDITPIDDLYKSCSELYSKARKEFCSRKDIFRTFQINNQKMVINLLNLTCHDGKDSRPKELWNAIHKLDDIEVNAGLLKDFNEFRSLNYLLSNYPQYYFKKSEKPDFILKNDGILFGLEVTSAVTTTEAQVNKIAKYNFGRNRNPNIIRDYIVNNHRTITKIIDLIDINGRAIISPSKGMIDCHSYKELILERVLNKINKAKTYSKFSELWIVIDTENAVCFNEEHDAKEVSSLFKREEIKLVEIDKIFVINILNRVIMSYDVKHQEYHFKKINIL
jgi:hypothetical protein